ncbi:hypothetical protein LJ207_03430 [Halanaerobium sp. Z-7514]|uniref:Methyltransferase domain-containing protein n=1 Tax=Halanaerobium polyolivorans TaxID=2886943 RepID=A0AAW4WTF4_9FIRM|nr:class I SAM-dependent methyltransferase [Halanaerobium polyolivorans]MCC3144370.1 hypothetical protein [Halanaerobium polyolivorans]RQD75329.1 MAG: class I SAM-dependent methyltransferase [Halanaerobium sp. MSAO_Bac5]
MRAIRKIIQQIEKKAQANDLLFKIYARPYKKTVAKEIKLGNINSEDVVLNIGCGALPFTAYYIHKLSGAKVIAVDYDKNAILQAQKLMSKLKITEEQIEFLHLAADRALEKCNYSKVLAALQTEGKNDIYKKIKLIKDKKIKKLLIREPRKKFYDAYDKLELPRGAVFSKAKQNFLTFDRTLCFDFEGSL